MNHSDRRNNMSEETIVKPDETIVKPDEKKPELTLELVKEFCSNDENAKKWIQGESDGRIQQALISYKENTVPGLIESGVEEKYQKDHPDETEESKALRDLRKEIEKTKLDIKKERLMNLAIKMAGDKNLPSDIVTKLIGDDEEQTKTNIIDFETVFNKSVSVAKEEQLKGTGKQTPVPLGETYKGLTPKLIVHMTDKERAKYDPKALEQIMKQHYGSDK